MIFKPLCSSSHGNAYLVNDGCSTILIECGPSFKKLQQLCGFGASFLDGCLISHEHKDHSGCVDKIIKAGVPVYLSQGTAAALASGDKPVLTPDLVELAHEMEAGKPFQVGSFTVQPFPTFHDAGEPLGFLIRSNADGDSLAFAIDTVNIPYSFPGTQILALESNYDRDIMARCTRMPAKVQHRVTCTHMEIHRLCQCLQKMDLQCCREIWLMHMSDACSHEAHFINKVQRAVPPGIQVRACPR